MNKNLDLMKLTYTIIFVFFVLISAAKTGNNSKEGIIVSSEELNRIKNLASKGIEPHLTNIKQFINFIDELMESSNQWGEVSGEVVISGGSSSKPIQLSSEGGKLVYGTAIAWHLTQNKKYAIRCRELILDLTDTYGYRNSDEKEFHWGSQGILNLARGGTPYIYAACLLEGWDGWSDDDKLNFQIWLRDTMYPKVSWASRTRKNNWGVAGSFSASVISYYLMNHDDWILKEISPEKLELSPQQAFDSHNEYQIQRLSTSKEFKMDAKVSLWGILPNGAIPEEIRRGNDPINGECLESEGSGTNYTMTHIEHLIAHAEFLHRHGDNSLYNHVDADGSGSLLQAILFVIDNPVKSHCFSLDGMNGLYMAYNFYKHPAILKSIKKCGPSNISGLRLALYGRLTHPLQF